MRPGWLTYRLLLPIAGVGCLLLGQQLQVVSAWPDAQGTTVAGPYTVDVPPPSARALTSSATLPLDGADPAVALVAPSALESTRPTVTSTTAEAAKTATDAGADAAPTTPDADASIAPAAVDPSAIPTPTSTAVACQPFALTYTGSTQKDGNTTYSYTLIGGGPTDSGCKNIVSVALPVCFNPDLVGGGGSVVSESHPSTPAGWGYQPQGSESTPLATWTALGPFIGSGPFDAVFSLTLKGTVIPLTPTVATVNLVGWNAPIVAGTVVVPAPEGCAIASATAATPTPDPVRSGDGKGSFVTGPNATSNDSPPRRTPTPASVGNASY